MARANSARAKELSGSIADLLRQVSAPTNAGAYHVLPLVSVPGYFAARDSGGRSALLIRTKNAAIVPMRVAGIEVRFGVECELVEPGHAPRIETITVVQCLSDAKDIESYFAYCLEGLASQLGQNPSIDAITAAVSLLVDLFQRLRKPAARPLLGLVGELCILLFARSPSRAIQAWRSDPNETFDFALDALRLDAKASSHRQRVHSLSFEQVQTPADTIGLFASIWIVQTAGGVSVGALVRQIEARLSRDHASVSRLRSIVASTLGDTAPAAMEWSFDAALAKTSLQFFRADAVPSLSSPLPPGVSGVRFSSDFAMSSPLSIVELANHVGGAHLDLFPA